MNNGSSDPFAKVNSKARKLIESVERNRNSTVERRMGSTGGSSTQQVVEITGGVVNPGSQMHGQVNQGYMNLTTANFYSPKNAKMQS